MDPETAQKYVGELQLPWKIEGGKKIYHEFKFKDFKKAMAFVNKVADLAEEEGHHPDFIIHYNEVELVLWTHAVGGLSVNDFIMAAKINGLANSC